MTSLFLRRCCVLLLSMGLATGFTAKSSYGQTTVSDIPPINPDDIVDPVTIYPSLNKIDYKVSFGDTLSISSPIQTELFRDQAPGFRDGPGFSVRPDGKITLPLIGELLVGGMTTKAIAVILKQKYKPIYGDLPLTVNVLRFRTRTVSILGEVRSPGTYEFNALPTLLQVLSKSGGLSDYAVSEHTTVLRRGKIIFDEDINKVVWGYIPDMILAEGDVVHVNAMAWKPVFQNLPFILPLVSSGVTLLILVDRIVADQAANARRNGQ
jgi:hypothetical protein